MQPQIKLFEIAVSNSLVYQPNNRKLSGTFSSIVQIIRYFLYIFTLTRSWNCWFTLANNTTDNQLTWFGQFLYHQYCNRQQKYKFEGGLYRFPFCFVEQTSSKSWDTRCHDPFEVNQNMENRIVFLLSREFGQIVLLWLIVRIASRRKRRRLRAC